MSLQVWLPLNGHIKNYGLSNTSISLVNNPTTIISNRGKVYNLNPNNENNQAIELNIPDMPEWVKNEFSIAFWVYHRETSDRSIFFGSYNLDGNYSFNLEKVAATNKLRIYMQAAPDLSVTNCIIPENEWVHIVITKSATEIKIYKNSELVHTRTHSSSDLWKNSDSTKYRIGRDNRNNATALNGMISDFRIYNHILSKKEINELAQGLILNYSFDNPYMVGNRNLFTGIKLSGHGSEWIQQNETYLGQPIYKNKVTSPNTGNNAGFKISSPINLSNITSNKITLSFYKRLNVVYGKNLGGYITFLDSSGATLQRIYWNYNKTNWSNDSSSIGKWEKIIATGTITADLTKITKIGLFYVYVDQATGGNCDFSNIQLEFGSTVSGYSNSNDSSVIDDVSGYGNHGTIYGTNYLSNDTCRGNYSLQLAGASDSYADRSYVLAPLQLSNIKNYTFAANIKVNTWGKQASGVWCADPGNATPGSYTNSPCHHRDGHFDIAAQGNTSSDTSATYKRLLCNASDLIPGEWIHIAVTYNGQTASLYRNGIFIRSVSFDSATILAPCNYIFLSYSSAGGAHRVMRANWSDFRVYTTALNASAIKNLAEGRAAIDKNNNFYAYGLQEDYDIEHNVHRTGDVNIKVDTNLINLYPNVQHNASRMNVEYNYKTDIFKEFGFNTCTKFSANQTSTSAFMAYSYIMPTVTYTASGEYSFSCYAYVSQDCNANLRINLEQNATWVKNYQGTKSNINDNTKGQVIKVWGTVKANSSGKLYIMFYPNPNQANVFTSGYFLIAGMTFCQGSNPMHPISKGINTTNLITTMSAGGRTTLNGTHGLNADFSQNVDTYGYFNVNPPLELNKAYTLTFNVSNFPSGAVWAWRLWNNANYEFKVIDNGFYSYTFIPQVSKLPTGYSLSQFLFDDGGRTNPANIVQFTNFKIEPHDGYQFHGLYETNKAAVHKNYMEVNNFYED